MKKITFSDYIRRIVPASTMVRVAAAGLMVCGSSCSSVSQYVKQAFQRDHQEEDAAIAKSQEDPQAEPSIKHASTKAKKSDARDTDALNQARRKADMTSSSETPVAREETASKDAALAASAPVDPTRSAQDAMKRIAKGEDPFAAAPIQQASAASAEEITAAEGSCPPIAHPIEPRTELSGPFASGSPACPSAAPCAARPFPSVEVTGDELLCDGGDKGPKATHEGEKLAGVGVEDTVAEFVDDQGQKHIQPSTQACVYAPKFGSVSSATQPQEGSTVAKALGHQDEMKSAGFEAKVVIDQKVQTDEPQGMLMRSRPSGLEGQAVEDHLHQNVKTESHVRLTNAFEDFRFIREGQLDRAGSSVVALGVTAAQEWADGRRPIIIAHDQAGQVVQGRFTAQDYTGVEDRRTPGELTLVKVADKGSAHPGDVITFTIRFDNVGDRELFGVRLVDNLSPRLAYVEGSVSSNLDGQIDVDENGFGGKMLSFTFDQPLKGHTGGYVTFQCSVR